MGYHVEVTLTCTVIRAARVPKAVEALKELMAEVRECGGGGSWQQGKKTNACYSWVTTATVVEAVERGDIIAALKEWRYEASEGDPMTPTEQLAAGSLYSDVHIEYFTGEKWGDDDQLWAALAPFIDTDAVATFRGEDDHLWRYVFRAGNHYTAQTGTIVWE